MEEAPTATLPMDPLPLRDPAGLVARSPELARLAERSPSLRRAIEHGRPLDAYRALYWAHRTGRFRDLGDDAATLLGHRRLFVKPLTSAPVMFTYNGIGTSLYGTSDVDPRDGTYVGTLFAVFIFVPLFPIASYLVRNSPEKPGRAWNFIAKVPLASGTYFWQRGVALGLLALLLVGLGSAFEGFGHNTIDFVNGLDRPVRVQVSGARTLEVPGGDWKSVRSAVGKVAITILADGRVVESDSIDVPRGSRTIVWNVLGAAPIYVEQVVYSSAEDKDSASRPPAEPEILCGKSLLSRDRVDDEFQDSPKSVSMPKGSEHVVRWHLGIAPGGAQTCGSILASRDAPAAERWAMKLTRALLLPASKFRGLSEAGLSDVPAAEGEAFAKELIVRDDSVEAHRLYQDVLLASDQRARVVAEYEARLAAGPDSADMAYLALRARTVEEQRTRIGHLLARYPDHPYLRRLDIYVHYAALEFPQVLASAQALMRIDRNVWLDTLDQHIDALAGMGRGPEATALLHEVATGASNMLSLKRHADSLAYRIACRFGTATPDLDDDAKDDEALPLLVRATSGREVSGGELDSLKDPETRDALAIVAAARAHPDAALAKWSASSRDVQMRVPASVQVLLQAEGARRGQATTMDVVAGALLDRRTVAAMLALVQRGETADEIAGLPLEFRAALEFVRSRANGISEKERAERLARARACDVLRGPVTVAIDGWKS
jgi:hypothetical protein